MIPRVLPWLRFALAVLLLLVSSCSLVRLRRESRRLDHFVRVAGRVEVENWSGDPIVVVLLRLARHPGVPPTIERRIVQERPSSFVFTVPPGVYRLGAFEDRDRNFRFDLAAGERGGGYKELQPFLLLAKRKAESANFVISDRPPDVIKQLATAGYLESNMFVEGRVVPLHDARFHPSTGPLGHWQPLTFVERYGMGVFMLQPYDRERTPVLFVHGMSGHPREFTQLIACLDHTRFQPWVAQYPSGLRLASTATGLHRVLSAMHLRLGFKELHVVAHSMGGLVARRVVREHAARSGEPFITALTTLASPLDGIASAERGVELSPVIVPAWRDLTPQSEFVRTLYSVPLPAGTVYTLLFGYLQDGSDGVVRIASQLRAEAQSEATRMRGLPVGHAEILSSPAVCRELNGRTQRTTLSSSTR
jgi:pimeloyl-ACP methyl ester carboxylesterase